MKTIRNQTPKILIYGFQRFRVEPEPFAISEAQFEIADIGDAKRFQDYDGVILPQGCFEKFSVEHYGYEAQFKKQITIRKNSMRRRNEGLLLLKNNGFLCFIIHKEFIFRQRRLQKFQGD